MVDDRDRAIRDYAVLTPQFVHPGIVRPEVEAINFEFKLVMFQMLQTVVNLIDCHLKILISILSCVWK